MTTPRTFQNEIFKYKYPYSSIQKCDNWCLTTLIAHLDDIASKARLMQSGKKRSSANSESLTALMLKEGSPLVLDSPIPTPLKTPKGEPSFSFILVKTKMKARNCPKAIS